VQGQIDRITRAREQAATADPLIGDGGPEALDPGDGRPGATVAGGAGAVFESLASGMASLKGLNVLGKQLQASGSWLEGIQQLTSQLSADQVRTAAQEAISNLPEGVRSDLTGRLASGTERLQHGAAGDVAGVVTGYLRENGGTQQLLSVLMVARAGPGGAAMSLVAAMKDPTVREFAKSLMSALVRAKGRQPT
jgi:hypothetical protein